MNVLAKFDEIPSMILEVIKETKRYGHTDGLSDNVKTVYPPTNTVCGGYNYSCRNINEQLCDKPTKSPVCPVKTRISLLCICQISFFAVYSYGS